MRLCAIVIVSIGILLAENVSGYEQNGCYRKEKDTVYIGLAIGKIPNASVDDCLAKCDLIPKCKAAIMHRNTGSCALMSVVGSHNPKFGLFDTYIKSVLQKRPCAHLCHDTPRGVQCSCLPGYRLAPDGRGCEDIDECASESVCPRNTACFNTRGAYVCVSVHEAVADVGDGNGTGEVEVSAVGKGTEKVDSSTSDTGSTYYVYLAICVLGGLVLGVTSVLAGTGLVPGRKALASADEEDGRGEARVANARASTHNLRGSSRNVRTSTHDVHGSERNVQGSTDNGSFRDVQGSALEGAGSTRDLRL